MSANLENSVVATGLGKISFDSILKKGNAKKSLTELILLSSKVMLKIFQTRLQQYLNRELPDAQAWFRNGRGTRDQTANIQWIIVKAREFQKKKICFCFIDYMKAFDCVDHNKLWKILREIGIPGHLIHLLKTLYVGQKATVRMRHGTKNWFKIGKVVC